MMEYECYFETINDIIMIIPNLLISVPTCAILSTPTPTHTLANTPTIIPIIKSTPALPASPRPTSKTTPTSAW